MFVVSQVSKVQTAVRPFNLLSPDNEEMISIEIQFHCSEPTPFERAVGHEVTSPFCCPRKLNARRPQKSGALVVGSNSRPTTAHYLISGLAFRTTTVCNPNPRQDKSSQFPILLESLSFEAPTNHRAGTRLFPERWETGEGKKKNARSTRSFCLSGQCATGRLAGLAGWLADFRGCADLRVAAIC